MRYPFDVRNILVAGLKVFYMPVDLQAWHTPPLPQIASTLTPPTQLTHVCPKGSMILDLIARKEVSSSIIVRATLARGRDRESCQQYPSWDGMRLDTGG